jgi:signal peptidase I
MDINFPLILLAAVVITGLIWLVDILFFARKRKTDKLPVVVEYAKSFFPILLLVFVIRSFLVEPFRIPSGSLEPTLLAGDFIIVNKFHYGLRWPLVNTKIIPISNPKTGDIVVFHWPPNPTIDYIKRVIGVPGDHISYINKILYINNKPIPQKEVATTTEVDEMGNQWKVVEMEEDLLGVKHNIYIRPEAASTDLYDIVVPDGKYFVMGDNRDDSQDSRYWGFVPNNNLVGNAIAVWLSWNGTKHNIRWDRIGKLIH